MPCRDGEIKAGSSGGFGGEALAIVGSIGVRPMIDELGQGDSGSRQSRPGRWVRLVPGAPFRQPEPALFGERGSRPRFRSFDRTGSTRQFVSFCHIGGVRLSVAGIKHGRRRGHEPPLERPASRVFTAARRRASSRATATLQADRRAQKQS